MNDNLNKSCNKEIRIEWIDVLKCLTMLLVVVGHASQGSTPDTYRYYIYSFHMPLFFIISGMTFYLQCEKKSFTFPQLVKNKAKGLVLPYFILSFLTIPVWILNFRVLSFDDRTMGQLVYAIFYSHENHISSPSNAMWFCLTLFLTILVFWLLNKWAKGDERIFTCLVGIIGSYGYSMSLRKSDFFAPWHIETVPIALVCVLAGWLFIKNIDFFMNLLGSKKKAVAMGYSIIPFCIFLRKIQC